MKVLAAAPDAAPSLRLAIVVSRFNHLVSVRLLEGATAELARRGVAADDVHVAWVPGAFEIPQAARVLADTRRYDAIIFDYVCHGVTDGVREVMRDTGVPVAFGVLTTDDVEQALERAGGEHGNKGRDAAQVALEMARLLPALRAGSAA